MMLSGVSKVMETESSRRDVEQREAVLRATNKQLQDSLQRQMTEASSREERLRDEINEMRKRWQEAIASRENLSYELSAATAPLLRQISSLQESIRVKNDSFQSIESSLSEKALKAESSAQQAEARKQLLEEQNSTMTKQIAFMTNKINEMQQTILSFEEEIRGLKSNEMKSQLTMEQLQIQLGKQLPIPWDISQEIAPMTIRSELQHMIDIEE